MVNNTGLKYTDTPVSPHEDILNWKYNIREHEKSFDNIRININRLSIQRLDL